GLVGIAGRLRRRVGDALARGGVADLAGAALGVDAAGGRALAVRPADLADGARVGPAALGVRRIELARAVLAGVARVARLGRVAAGDAGAVDAELPTAALEVEVAAGDAEVVDAHLAAPALA